jgi:hypothetical protein
MVVNYGVFPRWFMQSLQSAEPYEVFFKLLGFNLILRSLGLMVTHQI